MTLLIFAAVFALLVGIFCILSYVETGNEIFFNLARINFVLALTDFVILLIHDLTF